MFYDTTWRERAAKVSEAITRLIDEHGAPNRFHIRDVMPLAHLDYGVIGRVGRHGGEFVCRSRIVRYRRGWFEVGEVGIIPPHD